MGSSYFIIFCVLFFKVHYFCNQKFKLVLEVSFRSNSIWERFAEILVYVFIYRENLKAVTNIEDREAKKKKEEYLTFTPLTVVVFVVVCCVMIVLLYFFYKYLGKMSYFMFATLGM